MTTCDMDIVSDLRAALAEKVGRERFDLWFGASTRLEFDGHTLAVGVPSRFFLDWIRSNFRRHIERACMAVLDTCPTLKFHVDTTLPNPPSNASHATKGDAPRPAECQRASAEEAPPALPLRGTSPSGSTRRKFASLESFVRGNTNKLALTSAEMIVECPGQMNPLLIHGPTGVGKTHLLEGIWSAVRKSPRRIAPIYLSAEQFTTDFLDALRGSGLPSFRRKYRGVGLLILDDLQFLVGKRATQVELLHTADALLRAGRQLVFAADRPVEELAELGPELVSRLQSGMVCPIAPPDYGTRLGTVAQMARQRKLKVPPDVQRFIASRLTRHAREISGALCRLQATSEALRRPITLSLAEEALAEMIRHSSRVVRLPDIEKAVCDVFDLEPVKLQSPCKNRRVSHPRMLAMWLARKHTRAALSEIGQYFGRRSHSTVISAQRRVEGWMADGQSLHLADHTWDVDEAIRQVELRLQAG